MRMHLRIITLAIIAGVALGACGEEADGPGNTSSPAERVYYLLPTLEDAAYRADQAGAKDVASQVDDVDFTFDAANSYEGAPDMIRRLESAVVKKYDVVALLPGAVANEITPALRKATQAGIKIVSAGAGGTPVADLAETNIELDYEGNGRLMGEHAKQQLPDGGQAGIIDCFTEVPQTKSINDGIRASLEGSNIEVVARIDAKCNPGKARAAAENMLTAHPDLDVIFGIWDVNAVGARKSLEGKDVLLVGGGATADAVKMIEADNTPLKVTTDAQFFETGQELARLAIKVARGERLPETVTIKPILVTKENAADVLAKIERSETSG